MKKKRFFAVLIIISLITLPFSFKASAVSNSAKAAVVINGDTGEVIYAKNQSERLPMASTTKAIKILIPAVVQKATTEFTIISQGILISPLQSYGCIFLYFIAIITFMTFFITEKNRI